MLGGRRTTLNNSDYSDAATVAIKVKVAGDDIRV